MANSFDYQPFIDELKDEVGTGSLTNDEKIQILRDKTTTPDGYHPIIDWYYSNDVMDLELAPDSSDDEEDAEDKELLRKQYEQDKAQLEVISVEDCLKEMFGKTESPAQKSDRNGNPFF